MELTRLERLSDLFIRGVSLLAWRRPHRRVMKMFEFSFIEEDSFRDMSQAAELTDSAEMRAKYVQHALDEARHADLFRNRARALIARMRAEGQSTVALEAALERLRSGPIRLHEATHRNDLFSSLGELEFLAFVYVAERRGAQQFRIYNELLTDDPETQAMFARIMTDEKFHMSYSRASLDRLARDGQRGRVRWALLRVRSRRYWQAWLRFCRRFADVSNQCFFTMLYFVLVGPTRLLTRGDTRPTGWIAPENTDADLPSVQRQF